MRLVQLVMQLIHLRLRLRKSAPAGRGNSIHAPFAFNIAVEHLQQPSLLHPMQKRIKRAGSDSVTVVPQLIHHSKSKDRLMRRMQ